MTDAYIYDAVRTPRGKGRKDGSLHEVTPTRLAVTALQAIRDRNKLDTALVDDVVLGCVMPIGEQGANIARTAAVMAGLAETVPGVSVNRFCASGLEATNMAAAQVMAGQSQAVIGGGVESMSRVPMGSDGGAWPTDPAVAIPMYFVPQGISADIIATKFGMSRDDVDAYAVESQKRAKAAWDKCYQALTEHEMAHCLIAYNAVQELESQLVNREKSEAQARLRELMAELDATQKQFDDETDHGRNTGVDLDYSSDDDDFPPR